MPNPKTDIRSKYAAIIKPPKPRKAAPPDPGPDLGQSWQATMAARSAKAAAERRRTHEAGRPARLEAAAMRTETLARQTHALALEAEARAIRDASTAGRVLASRSGRRSRGKAG